MRGKYPKLSRHKDGRYGFVTWQGRKIRVPGRWPDETAAKAPPDVESAYWVIVGRILAGEGRVEAVAPTRELTVAGLVADFGEWVLPRVSRGEYTNRRRAWKILVEHAGLLPVKDFGSAHLYQIQDKLIEATRTTEDGTVERRFSRQGINKLVGLIRGIFYWGLERVPDFPEGVCERLRRVRAVAKFASGTRENPKTVAVSDEVVNETIPHLHEPIRSMVRLQRLCGMRPGEVIKMKLGDIDRRDKSCWWYRPGSHKKAWREQDRQIPIVPAAQSVVKVFLTTDPDLPIFQTVDNQGRRTGRAYRVDAYARAIARVCESRKITRWSPNQLRKLAAQTTLENLSREHAAALLGHDDPQVTSRFYLAKDLAMAQAGAEQVAKIVHQTGKIPLKRKSGKSG